MNFWRLSTVRALEASRRTRRWREELEGPPRRRTGPSSRAIGLLWSRKGTDEDDRGTKLALGRLEELLLLHDRLLGGALDLAWGELDLVGLEEFRGLLIVLVED